MEHDKGRKMKIAVPARNRELASEVDTRFGRADWLIVIDGETGELEAYPNAVGLKRGRLSGIQIAQNLVELGVEALLTRNIGPNALRVLKAAGVKTYLTKSQTVGEAVGSFKEGHLPETKQPNVEAYWHWV